jgi:hypothetical protein
MVILTVLLAVPTASCGLFMVQGSGNVITEEREVEPFHGIELAGTGTVIVDITGTESLTVEADDNILPELQTTVSNGTLILEPGRSVDPTGDIVYTVTAATLDSVAISGSGEIVVTGADSSEFAVDISGSGRVEAAGNVETGLDVGISGSGEFDGENLVASEGRVEVSGSGTAVVNVTDHLSLSLSGSGEIEYIGAPAVEVDKTGSGTITHRD